MNRKFLVGLGVAVVAAVILATSSLFIVNQAEQAIVLQFGDPKRVIQDPGLKVKLPFVQNVVYYDKRLLDFAPPSEEVIASDQKRLVIDAYARYRIVDPLRFYQSIGSEALAQTRLGATISGSLRRVIGNVTLAQILSDERSRIMEEIRLDVNKAAANFGLDVVDVRLRRADLPEENSQAIFARMQSEREREAREFRAQGAELAQRIRSRAERERTVIIAEAQRQAQILRGEGEGNRFASTPKRSVATRPSSRSTVPCRPTGRRSIPATRRWSCRRTATSSGTSRIGRAFGRLPPLRRPAGRR